MTKITNNKKIIVQGVSYDMDVFKIDCFDEYRITDILSVIEGVGKCAKEGYENMDSIVRHSPLHYIDGLIRFQLIRHNIEDYALSPEDLETPSDFIHQKDCFYKEINCCKLVFLFGFLSDIVCLSQTPSDINSESLNKIAMNLRTLFILCDSSFTGPSSHVEDVGFRQFAFSVWVDMPDKKYSGQEFWNRAISILNSEKYSDEAGFSVMRNLDCSRKKEKVDYMARLEVKVKKEGLTDGGPSKKSKVIKIYCTSHKNLDEKAKGEGRVRKIFPKLEKDFVAAYEKKGTQNKNKNS